MKIELIFFKNKNLRNLNLNVYLNYSTFIVFDRVSVRFFKGHFLAGGFLEIEYLLLDSAWEIRISFNIKSHLAFFLSLKKVFEKPLR